MVEQADAALEAGDVVAAGTWYVRIAHHYYRTADDLIAGIRPRLEAEAARGDADAKALLAGLLLEFDKEPVRAAQLFREAADAGVREGMRGLGHLFATGKGVPQDDVRAAELFRRSAELGDPVGTFSLAGCYRDGRGVPINAKEFLVWLRRAADLCLHDACALLAQTLERQRKPEEAWAWHLKAAELGNVSSAFVVADGYRSGNAWVPRDIVQSARWFLSTLNDGITDGFRTVVDMTLAMTADQVREAGVLSGREREAQMLIDRFFTDN